MDYEKVWSVNDVLKNRNNWSLSADSELLKHLQHLSKNILDKTRSTLELLESFESDVDRTCLSVANIGNRFKSLSDTQFIENKIQESPETELTIHEETKESRTKDSENVSFKLKEALDNGLIILSSHYDIINVSDSDSENEEPQEILLKSCNPFIKRRLPYIIGTNEFTKYDHLGLADSSSDDDEEDELADEIIEEEQPFDRVDILPKKNFTNIPTAQISSSDSEDSFISSGTNSRRDPTKHTPTIAPNLMEKNPTQPLPKAAGSFADHLNAALLKNDVKRPTIIPDCGRNDPFSPPPFPVKSNTSYSSDEEKSDSGDSVSSHSPVISRSSPYSLPTPLHAASNDDHLIKPNDGRNDELLSNEESISKPVENDDTLFTAGVNSRLNSDLSTHKEKKLSRALADEFKSTILAKNNSTLANRSSSHSADSKPISKTTSNNVVDVNAEKQPTTSAPFHSSRKDNPKGIDNDSDEEIDRKFASHEEPRQPTLVPAATESNKWYSNNADSDADDDDDDDDWFNRAVSSKTPRNTDSVTASKSSKLASVQNVDQLSVKETTKDTDSKTDIDGTSSQKKSIVPRPKKTEVEGVEKKYSLFGSEGEDDDDDYLFTKKAATAPDKNKTNELYDMLFNDSDVDDPILALVEENKRRVGVSKSTKSEISFDSKVKNVEDCEILFGNDSINRRENILASKPTIRSGEEMPKSESVATANISSSGNAKLDVNYKEKPCASRVTETDENILSKEIPNAEVKDISDDFLVSDVPFKNNESKVSRTVQIPKFYDVDFEKEDVESEAAGSVPKSNSSAVSKNTPDLSPKIVGSSKPRIEFPQSISDEPTKTVEKKEVLSENLSSESANSVARPNASKNLETTASPSENGSNTSENNITSPNIVTNPNDGPQIVNEETSSGLKTTKPGKLAVGRGINVNVNALLPGSKRSKPNPKTIKTDEMTSGDNEDDKANPIPAPVNSNLSSVTKDRAKIQSKRRPPTRRGRVAQLNVQSSLEPSVADDCEPASKDLEDSGPNSVTLPDPSPAKSTLSEHSSVDVAPVSAAPEDTLKNISPVGTSTNSKLPDVNSIFDTLFNDDDDEDIISNTIPAVISPKNVRDLPNPKVGMGESNVPSTTPSSQQKLGDKNVFGGSENDFKNSSISDKKIESSNLWKIADSPPKSNLLFNSSDEDDFIATSESKNNENLKSVKNSQTSGPLFKVEEKQSSSRTKKNEFGSSGSNVKSDLFADDDDEDFNKLFSSSKKPVKNVPSKSRSLFADDDEDDEMLFGVKTQKPNRKETMPINQRAESTQNHHQVVHGPLLHMQLVVRLRLNPQETQKRKSFEYELRIRNFWIRNSNHYFDSMCPTLVTKAALRVTKIKTIQLNKRTHRTFGMSLDAEPCKWTCEYCTYKNFPSAQKCTMCRGAKPLISEDIYKLRNDAQQTSDAKSARPAGASDSGDDDDDRADTVQQPSSVGVKSNQACSSWRCDVCKHVNSLDIKECDRCSSNSQYNEAALQERLGSLAIGENEVISAAANERCQSSSQKWTCSVCTYENWPKAVKCIMCTSMRGRISPDTSSQCVGSPEREMFINSKNAEDSLNRSKKSNVRRMDEIRCPSPSNNIETEKKLKMQRKLQRNTDRPWLNACMGVLNGEPAPVLAYLAAGGNPSRQLTQNEVIALGRPSAFDAGYTLVHLAIRFNREDMLATLLSQIEGSSSGIKRVPSYVAPDLAADIRRFFASDIRQRKSNFSCPFVNEQTTFFLPAEIEDLPSIIQEQLFQEILDKDVQQQLEAHPPVINWSLEVTSHLGSRLYALWNRSAGDCLLDSVMQASWGVFDRENTLRRALADALTHPHCGHMFYSRWREYESIQAMLMHFSLEETQWQEDWSALVSLATQPGSSLEHLHVFVLAHIFRRPIIVYGVKYVKSFRGENLGFAKFEGVYLPLLWEPNFCNKSPLALGYTRGHFSALVPMEPEATTSMNAHIKSDSELYVSFLPLMDHNHLLLPVHFISQKEMGQEERLLRQWLDVCVTDSGLLIAQQKLQQRPLLVAQMVEEWLNYYRRLAHMSIAPFNRPIPVQDYSSEGESDDE